MCLLQSTGGGMASPYRCAAPLPYQPEQPDPTQPRRKGKQQHLLERAVKKHQVSVQTSLSGASCTKPEITFQSVRTVFSPPDN